MRDDTQICKKNKLKADEVKYRTRQGIETFFKGIILSQGSEKIHTITDMK